MKLWIVYYHDGDLDQSSWYAGENESEAQEAWKQEIEDLNGKGATEDMIIHNIYPVTDTWAKDGSHYIVKLELREAQ